MILISCITIFPNVGPVPPAFSPAFGTFWLNTTETVLVGGLFEFNQVGVTNGVSINNIGNTFTIATAGVYLVNWHISVEIFGLDFRVFHTLSTRLLVNGEIPVNEQTVFSILLSDSSIAYQLACTEINGQVILNLGTNSILQLENPLLNVTSTPIVVCDRGTNAATINIFRIG